MRKLVLFDMDGVLYDSMPNHAVAWEKAMASFGLRFTADDAYTTEGARGIDTVRKYVKAQKDKIISEKEAQDMYDHKAHIFSTLPTAEVMPGVLKLMKKIKKGGMQIGVVTGSAQRQLISRILDDFGSFIDEEHIVTAYDVKRGKPHPEPYLIGMQKCGGYSPSETIVVENAPMGVMAGHASGAYTIAVNTGPLPNDALLSQGADRLFPSMKALADSWEQVIAEIN
jgi:beta-phosphoglucomutase